MRSPRDPRGPSAAKPSKGLFTKGEQRKLVAMSVALLAVVVAFVTSIVQQRKANEKELAEAPPLEKPTVIEVVIPEVDTTGLGELVDDATREARVVLERPGVERLMETARKFTTNHFEEMDPPELDATTVAEILADPAAVRGEAFTARGWLRGSSLVRDSEGDLEHHLQLALDDGTTVYAIVRNMPEDLAQAEPFLRVDGFFLKSYLDEVGSEWIAGPLLVSREARRSYRSLGPVVELPTEALAEVEDYSIEGGPAKLPFFPYWAMMGYARDFDPASVDWDAATVVDSASLARIMQDGEPFRGQPFRFPVSKLMGATVKRAPENPARVEEYTEGWIGNHFWPHLVHFRAPAAWRDHRWPDLVHARGFFLKKFAYTSSTKGVEVAPVFVLTSLEHHVMPTDNSMQHLAWIVGGVTVGFTVLIWFLLMRDKKRSKELHEALVRRRRERRARAQEA